MDIDADDEFVDESSNNQVFQPFPDPDDPDFDLLFERMSFTLSEYVRSIVTSILQLVSSVILVAQMARGENSIIFSNRIHEFIYFF